MQEQHDKIFSSIKGIKLVKGHRKMNSGAFDGIENKDMNLEQPYLERLYNTLQQSVPIKGLYDRLSKLNNGSKNRNTIGLSSSKDLPQNLSSTIEQVEIKETKYETESEKGFDESSHNQQQTEQTRPTLDEETVGEPSQQRLVNPFENVLQSRPAPK